MQGWTDEALTSLARPGDSGRCSPRWDEALLDAIHSTLVAQLEEIPGVGVVARLSSDFGSEERDLLERQGKGYRFPPRHP